MTQGTVRWFDADRGFGFVAPDDGSPDLFVHVSEVVGDAGQRTLREGQAVAFEVGSNDRGPQARQVRVTGDVAADADLGVLGTVSWYEPAKGYGFVAPDDGGPEVFVHSSSIVTGGVVTEGQRAAFLVVPGDKGPQAQHLVPLGADAGAVTGHVAADDGADGTVAWFDDGKGFGFLTPDDGGDDVFVHVRALAGGLASLAEGDRVTWSEVEGDRGPQARDVRLVGAPPSRPASRPASRSTGRPQRSAPTVRGGEGTVARFDGDRGFGFISPDDGGDDLFVHVTVVEGGEALYEGDRVRFSVRQSDRGPQADRVTLL